MMSKLRMVLRWCAAAAVVILLLMLAWNCIDLYRIGTDAANRDENGVLLSAIYTRENIAARLETMVLPAFAGLTVIAAAIAAHAGQMSAGEKKGLQQEGEARKGADASTWQAQAENKSGAVSVIRAALLVVAVAFIVLGVMNGGLYDVLVKAINICTECIGLG